MKFHYTATDVQGVVREGNIIADTSSAVLEQLSKKGLKPISISRSKGEGFFSHQISFGKKITVVDQIFLTKHLALMLRLGTDLFKALDILIEDTPNKALKDFLEEIRESLERGQPFYSTFARYPYYFSPVFVNLVEAGESSGNLDTTFDNLSSMLAKQEDLRRRVKSAIIYPILLLIGSFLILVFLVTFALPRIAEVFLQGGLEVPTFSYVVFSIGLFFSRNIIWIAIVFLTIVFSLIFFFRKTLTGKRAFLALLNKIPVVSNVVQKISIQRFSGTLSTLMKAGIPIVNSLKITASAVGHQGMSEALVRIATEGVSRGLSIGESFKREKAFPLSIQSLIAVSERAGHLDEVLDTLSTFYESEIDSSIKGLVSFIEPVLLIFIGIIVLFIALSVIVPVYQLIGQF